MAHGAVWLAMWSSMAIARRGAFPMPGAIYFGVMAADAVVVTLAFAVDRAAAPRLRPVLSTRRHDDAQVPLGDVATLYPKTGDLLSWLGVAGVAIVLALSLIR